MDAQVPLVMALDDPGATPGVAGGKGASLARLARAGFRVPPGFHVTTSAYLDFAGRGGLREAVLGGHVCRRRSDAATFDAAAARIGDLFAGQPLPASTAAAIAGAYACLGDDVPVAVRSSATVEDLPGLSAAGQHDTYLNVRGEAAVLDAVKRCWASLWSARAIGYRARRGIEPGEVSIAVVVQQLVPAEAAGVMFTVDPVGGARDKVVISANWGLGESVVAGDVTPDVAVVDRASGTLVSYQVGSKETMTVADGAATRAAGTPPGLRSAAVLSPGQASELARVGLAIEELYDEPVDVEWALAAGELSVVQARPITTPASRPAAGPGEQWNDSLAGDYLWSNGNLGEAFPDVMTPATWSFVELLMSRMTFPPSLPGYRGYGRIGGRFYANVSMSISLEALVGISPRRFAGSSARSREAPSGRGDPASAGSALEGRPADGARGGRDGCAESAQARSGCRSSSPARRGRCDRLRAEIEQTTDAAVLASLWPAKVRPLVEEACEMLAAATAHGTTLLSVPGKLATLVGEADSALLLSGQQAGGASLASLGPATGLARLARGEIDRDTFARRYGHRGSHEVELSIPRPAEDPAWIDGQLAAIGGTARDADALLAGRKRPAPRPGSGWHTRTPRRRPRRASSSRAGRRSPVTARRPDPRSRGRRGWRVTGCGAPGSSPVTAMTCSSWSCRRPSACSAATGHPSLRCPPAGPLTRPTGRCRLIPR